MTNQQYKNDFIENQMELVEKHGIDILKPFGAKDRKLLEEFEKSKSRLIQSGCYEEYIGFFHPIMIGQAIIRDRLIRNEIAEKDLKAITQLDKCYLNQLLRRSGYPITEETLELKKAIVLTKRFKKTINEKFKSSSPNQ